MRSVRFTNSFILCVQQSVGVAVATNILTISVEFYAYGKNPQSYRTRFLSKNHFVHLYTQCKCFQVISSQNMLVDRVNFSTECSKFSFFFSLCVAQFRNDTKKELRYFLCATSYLRHLLIFTTLFQIKHSYFFYREKKTLCFDASGYTHRTD